MSYACEIAAQALLTTRNSVGVDVGMTWFAITSDGEFVENPLYFQNSMKKLRVAQRSVAPKKNKRSNSRRKAVRIDAKLYLKVSRQHSDLYHKTAVKLDKENDLIAHGDSNVGGLGRDNLAHTIHNVGWSQFF
ncbi:transposase [Deinococcus altitudinis]|uniref:transposase n=1 Tax=Deinococcus altitudinis TaxID=468914 RepID=UPI00389136F9